MTNIVSIWHGSSKLGEAWIEYRAQFKSYQVRYRLAKEPKLVRTIRGRRMSLKDAQEEVRTRLGFVPTVQQLIESNRQLDNASVRENKIHYFKKECAELKEVARDVLHKRKVDKEIIDLVRRIYALPWLCTGPGCAGHDEGTKYEDGRQAHTELLVRADKVAEFIASLRKHLLKHPGVVKYYDNYPPTWKHKFVGGKWYMIWAEEDGRGPGEILWNAIARAIDDVESDAESNQQLNTVDPMSLRGSTTAYLVRLLAKAGRTPVIITDEYANEIREELKTRGMTDDQLDEDDGRVPEARRKELMLKKFGIGLKKNKKLSSSEAKKLEKEAFAEMARERKNLERLREEHDAEMARIDERAKQPDSDFDAIQKLRDEQWASYKAKRVAERKRSEDAHNAILRRFGQKEVAFDNPRRKMFIPTSTPPVRQPKNYTEIVEGLGQIQPMIQAASALALGPIVTWGKSWKDIRSHYKEGRTAFHLYIDNARDQGRITVARHREYKKLLKKYTRLMRIEEQTGGEGPGAGSYAEEVLQEIANQFFDMTLEDALAYGCEKKAVQENPKLSLKKGKLFLGKKPMKLATADVETLSENILNYGPLGPNAAFFGYHPNTHILYMLIDPAKMKEFIHRGQTEKGSFPIFALRTPIGQGSIPLWWERPLTRYLAGAVQLEVHDDKLIVTHMTVREKWRRQGVNTGLINFVQNKWPGRKLFFHELTTEGRAFMTTHGGEELKNLENVRTKYTFSDVEPQLSALTTLVGKYGINSVELTGSIERLGVSEHDVDILLLVDPSVLGLTEEQVESSDNTWPTITGSADLDPPASEETIQNVSAMREAIYTVLEKTLKCERVNQDRDIINAQCPVRGRKIPTDVFVSAVFKLKNPEKIRATVCKRRLTQPEYKKLWRKVSKAKWIFNWKDSWNVRQDARTLAPAYFYTCGSGKAIDALLALTAEDLELDEPIKIIAMEAAPWNRGKKRLVRELGQRMIFDAIEFSKRSGHKGAIYGTPDNPPLYAYYLRLGMVPYKERYVMFTPTSAASFQRTYLRSLTNSRNENPRGIRAVTCKKRLAQREDLCLWREVENVGWTLEWDSYWKGVCAETQRPARKPFYIYTCGSGKPLDALMSLDATQAGDPVDIEQIEAAPWNRGRGKKKLVRGLGLRMIYDAIEFSKKIGKKGAIWLDSLGESVSFYKKIGMTELKEEVGEDVFEFTPEGATLFQREYRKRMRKNPDLEDLEFTAKGVRQRKNEHLEMISHPTVIEGKEVMVTHPTVVTNKDPDIEAMRNDTRELILESKKFFAKHPQLEDAEDWIDQSIIPVVETITNANDELATTGSDSGHAGAPFVSVVFVNTSVRDEYRRLFREKGFRTTKSPPIRMQFFEDNHPEWNVKEEWFVAPKGSPPFSSTISKKFWQDIVSMLTQYQGEQQHPNAPKVKRVELLVPQHLKDYVRQLIGDTLFIGRQSIERHYDPKIHGELWIDWGETKILPQRQRIEVHWLGTKDITIADLTADSMQQLLRRMNGHPTRIVAVGKDLWQAICSSCTFRSEPGTRAEASAASEKHYWRDISNPRDDLVLAHPAGETEFLVNAPKRFQRVRKEPNIYYHGTSVKRYKESRRRGLVPYAHPDLPPPKFQLVLALSRDPESVIWYAEYIAEKDNSRPLILEIDAREIPVFKHPYAQDIHYVVDRIKRTRIKIHIQPGVFSRFKEVSRQAIPLRNPPTHGLDVLITAPHAKCNTALEKDHECDVVAGDVAKNLGVCLQSHGLRVSLHINTTPRPDVDMNREEGRDTLWRQHVTKDMKLRPHVVVDVHSYPKDDHHFGPYDVVLYNIPDHTPKGLLDSLEKSLSAQGVRVTHWIATTENSIAVEAKNAGLDAILIEHSEAWRGREKELAQKVCVAVLEFLRSV